MLSEAEQAPGSRTTKRRSAEHGLARRANPFEQGFGRPRRYGPTLRQLEQSSCWRAACTTVGCALAPKASSCPRATPSLLGYSSFARVAQGLYRPVCAHPVSRDAASGCILISFCLGSPEANTLLARRAAPCSASCSRGEQEQGQQE